MGNKLITLVAFLSALGIGLFWFSGLIDKQINEAHTAGKAQCEAEYAKSEVKKIEKEKAVQNVQNRKAAVVWSRPNSRLLELIRRMRKQGIGTAGYHTEKSGLSTGRE